MSRHFKVPVGLAGLEQDPATGNLGDIYFNTTFSKIRFYALDGWHNVGDASSGTDPILLHTHDYNGNATVAGEINLSIAHTHDYNGNIVIPEGSGLMLTHSHDYNGNILIGNPIIPATLFGQGIPSNELGSNQDVYFDITNLNVYQKYENSWGTSVEINAYTKPEINDLLLGLQNTLSGSYVLTSDVGNPDGVASLDSNGKIPNSQLDIDEKIQDTAASMILNGTHSNISVSYNDTNGTLSLSGSAGGGGVSGIDLSMSMAMAQNY